MIEIDYFDLLGKEPIDINGICTLIPPTIKSIRKLTYKKYLSYCWILSLTKEKYLEQNNLNEKYDLLSQEEKDNNTLHKMIFYGNQEYATFYVEALSFFILEPLIYDKSQACVFVNKGMDTEEKNNLFTIIDVNNCQDIVNCILKLNYLKIIEEKKFKFANERARKLFEKIEKAKSENQLKSKSIDLPTIMSKFCIVNHSGINILNIDQLTIFQLYDQFGEYQFIKSSEITNMIYANTVSFSDITKYDANTWLNDRNNNKTT